MAELAIFGIDDYVIDKNLEKEDQDGLQKLTFQGAYPGKKVTKRLLIKNKTTIRVKYHWNIFKSEDVQNSLPLESELYFRLSPSSGYFEPSEVKTFELEYASNDYIPVYEYASLFIDDIPLQSIRNPPESLRAQIEEQQQKLQAQEQLHSHAGGQLAQHLTEQNSIQPGYFASNSARPSICYYEFELLGLSRLGSVEVTPAFYQFPYELSVGYRYARKFRLRNTSGCDLNYQVQLGNNVGEYLLTDIEHPRGHLPQFGEVEIEVSFQSFKVQPRQRAEFQVDFDFAHSLNFELLGDFCGPRVVFLQPTLDFGLLRSFSSSKQVLRLRNLSKVEALCRVSLQTVDTQVYRTSYLDDDIVIEGQYDALQDIHRQPQFRFSQESFSLRPEADFELEVEIQSFNPETHTNILRLEVQDSPAEYLNVRAEIQDIHVGLSAYSWKIEKLFANNKYVFDERHTPQTHLRMINYGNLPSKYNWSSVQNDRFSVFFDPPEGVVPPKKQVPIRVTLIPKQGGPFNEIFACSCEGLDMDIGFELATEVLGLSVEYLQVLDHSQEASKKLNQTLVISRAPGQKFRSNFLQKTVSSQTSSPLKGHHHAQESFAPFDQIEFYGCQINEPKTFRFVIKNTSGISTDFALSSESFQPFYNAAVESLTSFDENQGQLSQDTTSLHRPSKLNDSFSRTRLSQSKKQPLPIQKPVTLLTAEIEKRNNFTSEQGQELNAKKKLDNDQRLYLSNNKGIALHCHPAHGKLKAYSEQVITVTCFNDVCGEFSDNLLLDIKGLRQKKFPVRIDIKGTPVIVSPNQLGIDYKGDFPSFNLGNILAKSANFTRDFRLMNTGPKDIEIEWRVYNFGPEEGAEEEEEQRSFFNIEIVSPPLGSSNVAQLQFNPVIPRESRNGPFVLSSYREVIKGRKEKLFKVSFQSNLENTYNSVIIAQPRFVDNPEIKVGILALYLRCQTIAPLLSIDKLKSLEGNHVIKLQKWALESNEKESKKICLINKKATNLIFTVDIEGPFSLQKTVTNSPAKYDLMNTQTLSMKKTVQTQFNLVPTSLVELTINFDGPQISDREQWPLTFKNYKFGALNIHYNNGDSQQINLEGVLLRPLVQLNTSGFEGHEGSDVQDFGTVHINNHKTIVVYLSNTSIVPARWKLNHVKISNKKNLSEFTLTKLDLENKEKTDDPSVFEFSVTEGYLRGPSVPVRGLPETSVLPVQMT